MARRSFSLVITLPVWHWVNGWQTKLLTASGRASVATLPKVNWVKQADDVQIVKVWMLGISAFSQQAFACCKLLCSNSNKSEIVRRSLVFHVVTCFIYIS